MYLQIIFFCIICLISHTIYSCPDLLDLWYHHCEIFESLKEAAVKSDRTDGLSGSSDLVTLFKVRPF